MNTNEEKQKLIDFLSTMNKTMHHFAKKQWWEKRQLENFYEQIFKLTNFLPTNCHFSERIFYIKNNLNELQICQYCLLRKLKYKVSEVELTKTCGEKECLNKNKSIVSLNAWSNRTEKEKRIIADKISKNHSKSFVEKYGEERAKEIKLKLSQSQKGKKQSEETKRKRSESLKGKNVGKNNSQYGKTPWNKGLTKYDDERLEVKPEQREKLSKIMKNLIKEEKFTPPITNSWTKTRVEVKSEQGETKKFRSTWEAAFWLLNQHLKYEKIRIPYFFQNKERNYIVDFVDEDEKILYEIKPSSLRKDEIVQAKEKFAMQWCVENHYKFKIISNDWFEQNAILIDYEKYSILYKGMKQFVEK